MCVRERERERKRERERERENANYKGCHDLMLFILTEYKELDKQLDALDQALNQIERRRDKLHDEARQLLEDAKSARMVSQGRPVVNGENGIDSNHTNDDNSESDDKE